MDKKEVSQSTTQEKQIFCRPDVQTLYIDSVILRKSQDGHLLICGIQETPGMSVEQVRCMITVQHAIRLADKLKALVEIQEQAPEPIKKAVPASEKQKVSKKK